MAKYCPKCGKEMTIENLPKKAANSYNDCINKCEDCGIGLSNGEKNQTIIYKNYKDNIPIQLHEKLDSILENTLNKYNHKNKINKFGFNTSEDALTWIFFSYFIKNNKTDIMLKFLGFEKENIIDIYFWGAGYNNQNKDNLFRIKLEDVLKNSFKEDINRFSEPDIIIETDTKVIFIEVKYFSDNAIENETQKINKYIINDYYKNIENAINSKYYELIRNWSIGNLIADNKKYYLLNVGLKSKFAEEDKKPNIHSFINSLNNKNNFIRLSWNNIIENIKNENIDNWFFKEINKRTS
jgi:hypothetical protein